MPTLILDVTAKYFVFGGGNHLCFLRSPSFLDLKGEMVLLIYSGQIWPHHNSLCLLQLKVIDPRLRYIFSKISFDRKGFFSNKKNCNGLKRIGSIR